MGGFYYPRSGRSDWTKSRSSTLDIGYDSLQAYLDHLQLGKQGFSFIINQKHEFVYHPKKAVYSSSQEMQAMQPYIAVKDGYGKRRAEFYLSGSDSR